MSVPYDFEAADTSVDMEAIAYFDVATMHEGCVTATLKALREGVPVHRLPGYSTFADVTLIKPADQQRVELEELERQGAEQRRIAANVTAELVRSQDDEDAKKLLRRQGDRVRAECRRLDRLIEELRTRIEMPQSFGESFDVRTDVLVPALDRLRRCGGTLTIAEVLAFRRLVTDLSVDWVDGDGWWAQAWLLLNVIDDDGKDAVGKLGPIRWKVGKRGRGTQALRVESTASQERSISSRNHLRDRMVATGRINFEAATTALNASFPQLRALVIHLVLGDPLPEYVGEQWRDPLFVTHIQRIYLDKGFIWLGTGHYQVFLFRRQAVLDLLAERGPMRIADVMGELLIPRPGELSLLTFPQRTSKRGTRPIEPSMCSDDARPQRLALLSLFPCVCGGQGSLARRFAEIPADLLCMCRRMPRAGEFDVDPHLRFPEEYLTRPSPEECREELRARAAAYRPPPGGIAALTLQALAAEPHGTATFTRLREALGGGRRPLQTLELTGHGLIERLGDYRGAPWALTKQGKRVAGELAQRERDQPRS